jgi:hypothetical protein
LFAEIAPRLYNWVMDNAIKTNEKMAVWGTVGWDSQKKAPTGEGVTYVEATQEFATKEEALAVLATIPKMVGMKLTTLGRVGESGWVTVPLLQVYIYFSATAGTAKNETGAKRLKRLLKAVDCAFPTPRVLNPATEQQIRELAR